MDRVDSILSCFTHAVPGDFTVVSACGCCVVVSLEVAEYGWARGGDARTESSMVRECGRNRNGVGKGGGHWWQLRFGVQVIMLFFASLVSHELVLRALASTL